SSPSADPNQSTSQYGRHFGAAGRMGHQEVRASQIMGAQVKDNQNQELGTISDVILNPASGRVDFAVISLSGGTGTGSTASTTTTGTTSSTTGSPTSLSSAGKLVPVPWMLIRPQGASTYGSSTSGTTTSGTAGQLAFQFSGDSTKLQSA